MQGKSSGQSNSNFLVRASTLILLMSLQFFGSAQTDSINFNKKDLYYGYVLGEKTYAGNLGMSADYFLTKKLSVKINFGFGPLDYNGLVLSLGPQYYQKLSRHLFLHLGAVYLVSGQESASIEAHVNNNPHYYVNAGAQYIRSFAGLCFKIKDQLIRLEGGYSYILYKPSYSTGGQWDSKYTNWIDKGLGSGFSFGISYQFRRKNKRDK